MKYKNNILVLTYWSYEDALIQTYTLPYVRIIKKQLKPNQLIFLFTLEKEPFQTKKAKIEKQLRKEGIIWLPFKYQKFGLKALIKWVVLLPYLIGITFYKKITHIHCWCTPAGAIGYLVSLITRKHLILDSHEPHGEAMVENGEWKKKSLAFRLLFMLEKLQSKRAKHIIAASQGMKTYMLEKYQLSFPQMYTKPACVDIDLFDLKKVKNKEILDELGLNNKIVGVYAGKFGGIYLDHEVFDFFKVAHDFWGDKFHVLILSNHTTEEIERYCIKANYPTKYLTLKYVPHRLIPDYMGLGDFGITPVKPVPTKRYCTPIKDGEYWALGLPVVITKNISDDSDIISTNKIGAVLDNLDKKTYAEAVRTIDKLIYKKELSKKIRNIAIRYRSFTIAEQIYRQIY